MLLVVYVDDIALTGSNVNGIAALKKFLHAMFQIKDLGKLRYFIGIEVARSSSGINLSQRKYTLDLIDDTGFLGSKPIDTPMDPKQKLAVDEGAQMDDPVAKVIV